MVESDQKIAFRPRSATPVATITLEDMGAVASETPNDKPLAITRADDLGLPYQVDLAYYNVGAAYQVGTQYAQRLTTRSTNRTAISAAAVMGDQDAINAAAVILWDAWAGRLAFEFATGLKWAQLECTDIVTLVNDVSSNATGTTADNSGGDTSGNATSGYSAGALMHGPPMNSHLAVWRRNPRMGAGALIHGPHPSSHLAHWRGVGAGHYSSDDAAGLES
jgi:hypothetical protein